MNNLLPIFVSIATSSIALYFSTVEKFNPGRESYLWRQSIECDWDKIRSNPSKWLDQEVALEGWLQVQVDATGKVYDVSLQETFDSLRYEFTRRTVEVWKDDFLKGVSSEEIDSHAIAIMLSGKPVKITGKFDGTPYPGLLGTINGDIKVELIDERKHEVLSKFYQDK